MERAASHSGDHGRDKSEGKTKFVGHQKVNTIIVYFAL